MIAFEVAITTELYGGWIYAIESLDETLMIFPRVGI